MITKALAIYAAIMSTITVGLRINEYLLSRKKRLNENKVVQVKVRGNVIFVHEKSDNKGPYITVEIVNLTSSPVTITNVGLAALKSLKTFNALSDKFCHSGLVTINGKLDWRGENVPFKIGPYGATKIISPRTDFVNDLKYPLDPRKLVALKIKHSRSDDNIYIGLTSRRNEILTVVASDT